MALGHGAEYCKLTDCWCLEADGHMSQGATISVYAQGSQMSAAKKGIGTKNLKVLARTAVHKWP